MAAFAADDPGQNQRRNGGKDAHLDLGLSELGALGGDDQIAEDGDFTPPAQARAEHGGHRWDRDPVHQPEDPVKGLDHFWGQIPHVLAHVHAG